MNVLRTIHNNFRDLRKENVDLQDICLETPHTKYDIPPGKEKSHSRKIRKRDTPVRLQDYTLLLIRVLWVTTN